MENGHRVQGHTERAEALGIRVERHRRPPARITQAYAAGNLAVVIVSLSNTQRVDRLLDGRRLSRVSFRGTVTVVDPDYDVDFVVDGETDIVKFFLPKSELWEHLGGTLRPMFTEPHRGLERLGYRVAQVLARGEGTDTFVLADVLSGFPAAVPEARLRDSFRGGLAPRALRRVIDLIEHGLEQPRAVSLSLQAMAAEADLSVYHFAREFVRSVGVTPHQLALRRRLERARDDLIDNLESIQSVSDRYGFASQSHFVARFRRELGFSPGKLRALLHTPIITPGVTSGFVSRQG